MADTSAAKFLVEIHRQGSGSIKPTDIIECDTVTDACQQWLLWSGLGCCARLVWDHPPVNSPLDIYDHESIQSLQTQQHESAV
jgi:hypothetical protein